MEQNLLRSGYSDHSYSEDVRGCMLVINYAGIDPGKMEQVLERLSAVFPEFGTESKKEQHGSHC